MDNRRDICGICRGNNATCVKYQNVFWKRSRSKTVYDGTKDYHYDYNEITRIPAGAMHVRVKEESEDNFLVLVDNKGIYQINGNWRIQSPGHFPVHGSYFMYNRTWDGREILSASGPIRSDAFIYVLGSGDIPTIYYEYWISSTNPEKRFNNINSLNQIKNSQNFEADTSVHKKSNPLNRVQPKSLDKSKSLPETKIQGYKSYYHRNEILKSVPSWSLKRHRNYKYNIYTQSNTTTIPATESNQQLVTVDIFENIHINKSKLWPTLRKNSSASNIFQSMYTSENQLRKSNEFKPVPSFSKKLNTSNAFKARSNSRNTFNKTLVDWYERKTNLDQSFDEFGRPNRTSTHTRPTNINRIYSPRKKKEKLISEYHQKRERGRGRRRSSFTKVSNIKGECAPCNKIKRQTKNFCTKDFVLRAVVLAKEKQLQSIRYEIQVIQSYKNIVPISTREYLWTTDICECPKLRIGIEYILMGHSNASHNQRESRLLVGRNSFVRKYNQKRARTIMRLARDQVLICNENKQNT